MTPRISCNRVVRRGWAEVRSRVVAHESVDSASGTCQYAPAPRTLFTEKGPFAEASHGGYDRNRGRRGAWNAPRGAIPRGAGRRAGRGPLPPAARCPEARLSGAPRG